MVLTRGLRPAPSPLRGTSLRSCPKRLQAFSVFQELLGHEEITTTEIYLHVAIGTNGLGVKSPLDAVMEDGRWGDTGSVGVLRG